MTCFVESLTLYSLFVVVLPHLARTRPKDCYIFDATPQVLWLATRCARLINVNIELIQFRYVDVRDESGLSIGRRISCFDLSDVQAGILQKPIFHLLEAGGLLPGRLKKFLAKQLVYGGLYFHRESLERAVFLVQVVRWKMRVEYRHDRSPTLLLERRLWSDVLEHYASSNTVTILSLLPGNSIAGLSLRIRTFLRRLGFLRLRALCFRLGPYLHFVRKNLSGQISSVSSRHTSPLKIAVEYYGYFCIDQPEHYSDLFFWQQSQLNGQNILLTFNIAKDPIDLTKFTALKSQGLSAVALRKQATSCIEVPVFQSQHFTSLSGQGTSWPRDIGNTCESRWLKSQIDWYWHRRGYWEEFSSRYDVRMYVTWFKHGAEHCAIADALQDRNGITAIYQRSYEEIPNVGLTMTADIEFGFSTSHAEVERCSASIIPYHVAIGYPGDHRFCLLREKATRLRDMLKNHGAIHIMAFCDENTLDDSRWHKGHAFTQKSYAYLLNKVLSEPWFGLILKPKSAVTIRKRLGPVAGLLSRAESTGRCYTFEEGAVHSVHPPALAALAADVAIHEHLCAATSGVESALAGIPTLLMDQDGWHISRLYSLEIGKVIFNDWESAWKGCREHWKTQGGVPGFGDWSPMLKDIDPFRDGRAAERMGTYLHWLLRDLEDGLDRKAAMANAAERYCKAWGSDKVSAVNAGS